MKPDPDLVAHYYDVNVQQEWDRLERHRTEFAVTVKVLAERLPEPPASILDLGCGPGRYSILLAGKGYRVTLADLSRESMAYAREKARILGVSFEEAI
jgi:S-adenosylmethionine-dependent methyltransferase